MKIILSIFSFLVFSNSICQSIDISKLISKNDPSVFKIFAYDYSDNSISQGSGIFLSNTGNAITNFHVLENADSAYIITFDGFKYPISKILDYNQKIDLIKFKVTPSTGQIFKPVMLNTLPPYKGNDVFTISYPAGNHLNGGSTISKGIISGLRNIDEINLIQTTATITHGSSGGGLFDLKGNLIGITSGTFAEKIEDLHANLNKVIPSSYINKLNQKLNITLQNLKYNYNVDNLLLQASYEEEKGNYENSKSILVNYLMYNFDNPRAWLKLGNLYSKLKNQEMYRKHYQMALDIDSTYFTAYYNYAIIEAEMRNNELAKTLAEKGSRYMINSQYYYIIGYINLNIKDYSKAEFNLTKCLELMNLESKNNKYRSNTLYELAYCKYKLMKVQESKILTESIINEFPKYGFPYILYGDILYDLNFNIQACENYKKVLQFGNIREKKLAKDRITEICN